MNTIPLHHRCPKCAAPLPDDAPEGLCPECLLRAVSTPTETGIAPGAPADVPSLAAVQAAFPQLEILELIGAGGMGAVFKARQPKLDRCVALKLLAPALAASPAFAERFNREARVLARLNHPGIVNVFDFGQAGGFFFLLMEFVDGVNLRQAMRAGRFTPAQALALVPKICEALQFAHDEGILHRDIKPENLLLDTKGRIKIADFGIAKLVSEPRPVTKLTATGAAIGTPQYMAPEQLEHPEDVDARADIYSLGVVFYEMLTGELPLGRFAPPSAKSSVDARVDDVVLRTLEKERERRYASAGEVKTSVEHLTAQPTAPGATAPGFDPARDFILCPPQLPRMAQAIIIYTLTVAPVLWLLSLFTLEPLPDHPLVGFVQVMVNVLIYGLDFLLVILLAIGGWKLRGLRASAMNWLLTTIWLRIGCGGLAILGVVWVEMLSDKWIPDAPVPQAHLSDGLMVALGLAALVFEVSALVWLRRHRAALQAVCMAAHPHPTPPASVNAPRWSWKSVIGAGLVGLNLPLLILAVVVFARGVGGTGNAQALLLLGVMALLGVPGTILGWMGLVEIRAAAGGLRGVPLAVFAALAWPLGLLVGVTVVVPTLIAIPVPAGQAPPLWTRFTLLVPAGVLTFAIWAIYATARWGANRPASARRGVLKWIFLGLGLALAALTLPPMLAPTPPTPPPMPTVHVQGEAESSRRREDRVVAFTVTATPRENLILSATVLSNRVPVAQRALRTKLWPASGSKATDYRVRWRPVVTPGSSSWDIEVTDPRNGQVLARLCPDNLPQLEWTAASAAPAALKAAHEAREFELARALQRTPAGAVDWSVHFKMQSQPAPPTDSRRGMDAEVTVPPNQVAVFEVVTRSNGVVVPVAGLAAYQVNADPQPWHGRFLWADDPEDLDSLTALPRWSFGLLHDRDRLVQSGLGVPTPPRNFTGFLSLTTQLQPDHEVIEGLSQTDPDRPAYGLRIRTQTIQPQPGVRHHGGGFGTNWLKAVEGSLRPPQ